MWLTPLFKNRMESGVRLAQRLQQETFGADALILALPRGGVPVGFAIAQASNSDLDIFMVRKLGVPGHEEWAMGAVAGGGLLVLDEVVIRQLGIATSVVDRVTAREQEELKRLEEVYRAERPALLIQDRLVILVDDGLATGASMLAAIRGVRAQLAKRVIVAVPVASRDACGGLRQHVDEVICVETPKPFHSVGTWYEDFLEVTDDEVKELLERASTRERVAWRGFRSHG